jgi:hypothetical protein
MKITKVISPLGCANGACPSIVLTDSDVVLIQGVRMTAEAKAGLTIPAHEDAVSIPKHIFEELVSRYCRQPRGPGVLRG